MPKPTDPGAAVGHRGGRNALRATALSRGQSAAEVCLLLGMTILAIVALSRYLFFAATGRAKEGIDQLGGGSLLNADSSQLAFKNCQENWTEPVSGGIVFINNAKSVTSSEDTALQRTTLNGPTPAMPDCTWKIQ